MKRFTFIAVSLCLAFVMAAPAMAVEADVSGAYRARGFVDMGKTGLDTGATDAYMDMRLRVQTVLKVSDDLRVTTRFDALEKLWGVGDSQTGGAAGTAATITSDDNIDFDRAYMTFNTGIGKFDIGRMSSGTWGTSFIDKGTDADRIKFTTKLGDAFTLIGIFEKAAEGDVGTAVADADTDVYYLAGIYKAENVTFGVLYGYIDSAAASDTGVAATQATTNYHAILPYFTAKFGALRIQGEARLNTGDATDYDLVGAPSDVDKDETAYNLEVGFNFGAFDLSGGYAFASGDDGTNAAEDTSFNDGLGNDWNRGGFILTGNSGTIDTTLGSANLGTSTGNFTTDGGPIYGIKMIYGNAKFAVSDQLSIGVSLSYAEADEVPTTWRDEIGTEVDLTLKYKLMDNLSYTFIAAHLDTGDYYYGATSGVEPANFDDMQALYHVLQVSF